MGDWYTVGILVGLGAAIGVAATGVLRRALAGLVIAVVAAVAIGYVFGQWDEAVGGAFGAICGSLGSAPLVSGTLASRRHARRDCGAARRWRRSSAPRSRSCRSSATSRRSPCRCSARACAAARRTRMRACARLPRTSWPKPVVIVVIDGLTPSMFEAATRPRSASSPTHGEYRRAASVVPVADARVPRVDRDGRASRRARDPASRLVVPRGAADRRVRLVVRRAARGRASRARCATRSST